MSYPAPSPIPNPNNFNINFFQDTNEDLTLKEADARYLKLSGGNLAGSLTIQNQLTVSRTTNGEAIRFNNSTVSGAIHLQTSNAHIGTTSNHNFNIHANNTAVLQCLSTGGVNIINGLTANSSSVINNSTNYNGVMNTSALLLRQPINTNGNKISLDFIVSANVINETNTAGASITFERVSNNSNGNLIFSVKKIGNATEIPTETFKINNTGVCTFSNTNNNRYIEWTDGSSVASTFINSSGVPSIGTWNNVGLGFFTNSGSSQQFFLSPTSSRVGVGTNSPSFQFQVSTDSAAKPSTNTWTVSSDERIKENIEDANLDICYNNVKNLKLKRYKYKDNFIENHSIEDRTKLGWIAQEVKQYIPKAVTITNNEDYGIEDFHSLNSDQIIASLYGAVQKLIITVEQQQEFINSLEVE